MAENNHFSSTRKANELKNNNNLTPKNKKKNLNELDNWKLEQDNKKTRSGDTRTLKQSSSGATKRIGKF